MASSAAARAEQPHFKVPTYDKAPPAATIEKAHTPLEVAAKITDKQIKVKTLRHSDHVEVGKDLFDDHVSQILQKIGETNIISTPNLITLDNEEARIIVGQNVPFITGQFTTPASGGSASINPFQTIERRDIGLSLRVRPQISEGGTVKMAIYQETSNIQETTASGLITSKRSIDTNVLVDDGQIIVLGGLIEDSVNDTIEKVPGLGNIPILGYLFKYQTKKLKKTNLMVFLRPTVMRNDTQSVSVAGDRYDYIRNTQLNIRPENNVFLPNIPQPLLPPLEDGRSVGGALLHKEPPAPLGQPAEPMAPEQPASPAETFPVEPPVINLR